MRLILLFCLLLPAPVWAQNLPAGLPAALAKQIADDPARYYDDAAAVIWSYGQGGAIDQAGIDAAIAIDQARRRAQEMLPFLQADLDGDGDVAAQELAQTAAAQAARGRARLMAAAALADGDGDGAVTAGELAAYAGANAGLPARKLARLRAISAFDTDADGHVTLAELQTALGLAS